MDFSWSSNLEGFALGLGSASGIRAICNPAVPKCTKTTIVLWFTSYILIFGALDKYEIQAYYTLHIIVYLYRCLLLSIFSSRLAEGYGKHDRWKFLLITVYTTFHCGWIITSIGDIKEDCLQRTWTGLCHKKSIHRLFRIGTDACFAIWIMILDSVFVYHLARKLCQQHGLNILAFHNNVYHAFLQFGLLCAIAMNLYRLSVVASDKESFSVHPMWQVQDVIVLLLLTEFGCKYKLILSVSRPDTSQQDLETAHGLLSRAEETKNNILRYLHHELRNNLQRMIYLSNQLTRKERDLNKQSFTSPGQSADAVTSSSSASRRMTSEDRPKSIQEQDTMKSIQTCSVYIASVVEDVLTIENYESGTLVLRPKSYNLSELVESEFVYYQQLADACGRRISISNSLPASFQVMGDADRVRQVLRILGESCIEKAELFDQSSETKSSESLVSISAKVNGSLIVDLTAAFDSIFDITLTEPYTLLPGESTHNLSHSVVHRILKAIHGHMVLDQNQKRVRIIIPMEIDLNSDSESSHDIHQGCEKQLSMLIVDDSRMNRAILKKLLEGLLKDNVIIHEAENGQIATNLVLKEGHVYDIIWMDQVMPIKDGLAASNEIKAVLPTTVIIMVSANDLSRSPEMQGAIGPDDAILKPVNKTLLKTMLVRHKLLPDK